VDAISARAYRAAQQVVADHGGIIDLAESPSGGCAAIVEFRLDGDPI